MDFFKGGGRRERGQEGQERSRQEGEKAAPSCPQVQPLEEGGKGGGC